MVHLRADSDHRFADQLRFLATFPAYTTQVVDGTVVLWYRGPTGVEHLRLAVDGAGVTVAGDAAVARHVFNAAAAPLPGAGALPPEPAAHRLLYGRYGGIRPVLFPAAFEGIAWTILGQQVTVRLAVQLKANLARAFGRLTGEGPVPLWAFPAAEDIADQSADALRALQLSRQKAAALLEVARAMACGKWDPQRLAGMDSEAAAADLQGFRGIGRWTAEYILLRVIGHGDVFPAADAGLQRAWARRTGGTGRATDTDLRLAAQAWRGFRSEFAFYLWLDNHAERQGHTGAARRGVL